MRTREATLAIEVSTIEVTCFNKGNKVMFSTYVINRGRSKHSICFSEFRMFGIMELSLSCIYFGSHVNYYKRTTQCRLSPVTTLIVLTKVTSIFPILRGFMSHCINAQAFWWRFNQIRKESFTRGRSRINFRMLQNFTKKNWT